MPQKTNGPLSQNDMGSLRRLETAWKLHHREGLGLSTPRAYCHAKKTGFPRNENLASGFDGKHDSRDLPHNYTAEIPFAYVGTRGSPTRLVVGTNTG